MVNFEYVRGHVWVGRGKDVRVDLKWEELFFSNKGGGELWANDMFMKHIFQFERVFEVKLQTPVNTLNQIAEL